MVKLTTGSLFSGCGGLDLGLHYAGFETKWFCEADKWCRKILQKHWPERVIHEDANHLNNLEEVDVLAGGFPCQPVSFAGVRRGLDDPRWLWPAFDNAIRILRPPFVIVENVPGLFIRGFGDVLGALALQGYDADWFSLQSSDIGAPHRRKRVFILAAHPDRTRRWKESGGASGDEGKDGKRKENDNIAGGAGEGELQTTSLADTISGRFKKRQKGWKLQLIEQENQAPANTHGEYEHGSRGTGTAGREEFADGYFGDYEPAIRRWENLFRPAPNPKDEEGRLSSEFVEWMMGFPHDWTEGVSRTQRMKMLGNSVQVQSAQVVGNLLKEKVKYV